MDDLVSLGITTISLDVTDIKAIRQVRDDVARLTRGKLDILVNNAYVFPVVSLTYAAA